MFHTVIDLFHEAFELFIFWHPPKRDYGLIHCRVLYLSFKTILFLYLFLFIYRELGWGGRGQGGKCDRVG